MRHLLSDGKTAAVYQHGRVYLHDVDDIQMYTSEGATSYFCGQEIENGEVPRYPDATSPATGPAGTATSTYGPTAATSTYTGDSTPTYDGPATAHHTYSGTKPYTSPPTATSTYDGPTNDGPATHDSYDGPATATATATAWTATSPPPPPPTYTEDGCISNWVATDKFDHTDYEIGEVETAEECVALAKRKCGDQYNMVNIYKKYGTRGYEYCRCQIGPQGDDKLEDYETGGDYVSCKFR